MLNDRVYITCYGRREAYNRQDAIKEFFEAVQCCEGCERERYVNVYFALLNGETEIVDLVD